MTDMTGSGPHHDDAEGSTGSGDAGRGGQARDWMAQLQTMIDNVTTQAGPVLRDVAAKAAELAAVAGEKAGPIAHKAAEVTESAGQKLAERGRDLAAEMRRGGSSGSGGEGAATGDAPNAIDPTGVTTPGTSSGTYGTSSTDTYGTTSTDATTGGVRPDRPDSLGE